jgi:hypothetical protein
VKCNQKVKNRLVMETRPGHVGLLEMNSAFIKAVNDLQTRYQTTSLKEIYWVDLPCCAMITQDARCEW